MAVRIQLLGTFTVDVDGHVVDAGRWPRRSAATVVKALSLLMTTDLLVAATLSHRAQRQLFECAPRRIAASQPTAVPGDRSVSEKRHREGSA